jgi:uncharacterized protein (DUF1800 family)
MVREPRIEHLLRRAGFGPASGDIERYARLGWQGALRALVDFEQVDDDTDSKIGRPEYVAVTPRGQFLPNTNISDARQRWLFRMVHSGRPLQERMALFWHNHFATAYSKIAGEVGGEQATRMMAANPATDAAQVQGQIDLFREHALGNFRDLLVRVARDPAMLVWLDGRTNVKGRPQENFGRELFELFTLGVGHYTEEDIYAAARVFTGWNLRLANRGTAQAKYEYFYNAAQHDTGEKSFSFPIYRDQGRVIPSRAPENGEQDGLDLILALVLHPATARRLAQKLWTFFVSDVEAAPDGFVERIAATFVRSGFELKPVVRAVLASPEFDDPARHFARYAWPVEFVVRSVREVGWSGFSVGSALTPLVNMGQQLFEPPDVNGWELGGAWFSTSSMLARMNFASALTTNQRVNLRDAARGVRTPEALLEHVVNRLTVKPYERRDREALVDYLGAARAWTGSDADLLVKAAGLTHLVLASAQYQVI